MNSRLDRVTDWGTRAEEAHYRVADLAKMCGVTERQLRRFFRKKFGHAPHFRIAARRLEAARRLLAGENLIKEIAFEAGFSHQENFSRQFKQYYHVRPSEMRHRNGAAGQDVRI